MITSRHSSPFRAVFAAIAIFMALACDPLAGPSYPGEPRFVIKGQLRSLGPGTQGAPTYVALDWVDFGQNRFGGSNETTIPRMTPFVTQIVPIVPSNLPTSFILNVYDNPPASALTDHSDSNSGADGRLGTAVVIAFDDGNLDGIFTEPASTPPGTQADVLRGVAKGERVLFNDALNAISLAQLSGGANPTLVDPENLVPGFNLASTPCFFAELDVSTTATVTVTEPDVNDPCSLFHMSDAPAPSPVQELCRPMTNPCPAGETCSFNQDWSGTACTTSGTTPEGGNCSTEPCEDGGVCVDTGLGPKCLFACDDEIACPADFACTPFLGFTFGVCESALRGCSPFSDPCPTGQTCTFAGRELICAPAGVETAGSSCLSDNCLEGLICVPFLNPGPICEVPCATGNSMACPVGSDCVMLPPHDFGTCSPV